MTVSRRSFLAMAGLTAGGLTASGLLAGCGDGGSTAGTTGGTLRFVSWKLTGPGSESFIPFARKLGDDFSGAHTGWRMETVSQPVETYADKLIAWFSTGGDVPDVIHLPGRNFPQFAKAGWLEPLDSRPGLAELVGSFIPMQASFCKHKGTTYGVLTEPYSIALIHNQKLVPQPPTSPDELLSVAKAATRDGRFGIGLPSGPGTDLVLTTTFFLIGLGGHWSDPSGNPTANSDAAVEAVTRYKELLAAGVAPKGVASSSAAQQLLFEGKVAMVLNGPWGVADGQGKPTGPDLRAAKVPFGKGVPGGASNLLVIPKSSKHKDQAWDFVKGWAADSGQRAYTTASGGLPPNVANLTPEITSAKPWLPLYGRELPSAVDRLPPGFGDQYDKFAKAASTVLEGVFLAGKPIKASLDQLQADMEKLAKG